MTAAYFAVTDQCRAHPFREDYPVKGGDNMKRTMLQTGVALAVLATTALGSGQIYTCHVTGKPIGQMLL